MSSKDSEETRTMHTKSHNVEIMMGNGTDDIIKGLFESLLPKNSERLTTQMIGNEFIFDIVDLFIELSTSKNKSKKSKIIYRFS